MKQRFNHAGLFFSLLLLIFSTSYGENSSECSEKLKKSIEYFQKGKFNRTKKYLEPAKLDCQGHETIDSVLYYLGKAKMFTKEATAAKLEFEMLLQDRPQSPFAQEVQYLIGVCSYMDSPIFERDQEETRQAMREFNMFLDQNPQSTYADSAKIYIQRCYDKLAKKEFMNAQFYEKIDKHNSAIVYYRIVLSEYPDSKYKDPARYHLAENLIRTKRHTEGVALLTALIESGQDKEYIEKAKLLQQEHKAISQSDSDK